MQETILDCASAPQTTNPEQHPTSLCMKQFLIAPAIKCVYNFPYVKELAQRKFYQNTSHVALHA